MGVTLRYDNMGNMGKKLFVLFLFISFISYFFIFGCSEKKEVREEDSKVGENKIKDFGDKQAERKAEGGQKTPMDDETFIKEEIKKKSNLSENEIDDLFKDDLDEAIADIEEAFK